MTCPGCKGQGRFNNVDCPKCKATGKLECKAKGCTREVKPPTFESFADAFPCPVCKGKGTMMLHVACPCPECGGIGMTLAPKIDPTKMLR
jgi:RecJ-like exonuclease